MAVLAVAGAGALGSAAMGFGWQAGWLVGSAIGSLLFRPSGPRTEGPRLADLTVTSSAYGAPIPIGYGTLRMSGNVIWSSGIRERRRTHSTGKGGGGGSHTEYIYSASFAVAFSEGPAGDVTRLWADAKLIYDKTGVKPDIRKPGLRFRFHRGTETQLPDPLIERHVGTGRAPAHRRLAYLVLEDLALADFGNRIPNITAEITYRRAAAQPFQLIDFITTAEGGVLSSYQIDELAIDWHRGYGYFLRSSSDDTLAGIRRFSLRTMREDRQARMVDVTDTLPRNFPNTLFCGTDGHLYLTGRRSPASARPAPASPTRRCASSPPRGWAWSRSTIPTSAASTSC